MTSFAITANLFNFNPRTPRGVRRRSSRRSAQTGGNFNPRTPRGVRPEQDCHANQVPAISIHAPREGCDCFGGDGVTGAVIFQSTHPARGATRAHGSSLRWHSNFNPRTPRGVRQTRAACHGGGAKFQSTHPARGATVAFCEGAESLRISIHAPREGCDRRHDADGGEPGHFNPRTPRGVRLWWCFICRVQQQFQSTHPARGAT